MPSIRTWLEVGHTSTCESRRRSLSDGAPAFHWRVWLRSATGEDISHFVAKVVFHLSPASAFVYPKRVLPEPPYEIQESSYSSINIPIDIYIKYSDRPKKIKLKYTLNLDKCNENMAGSRCIYFDFRNPSEQLKQNLIKGGGILLQKVCELNNKKSRTNYKEKIIEPVKWDKVPTEKSNQTKNNINGTQKLRHDKPDPTDVFFKDILRNVSMTDNEINIASRLYCSYSSYEKTQNAIVLPPLSDPIYTIPELYSLHKEHPSASTETDYIRK